MNILHIWDQAGVACILAKYQRRSGHKVKIMKRSGYDPFGFFNFYNESLVSSDNDEFLKLCIKDAQKYEVIHVHSIFHIVPKLRERYPSKKLILHYHGSEVRSKKTIFKNVRLNKTLTHFVRSFEKYYYEKQNITTTTELRLKAENNSDHVLISTPDLKNYIANNKVKYVPNPVDIEHFTKVDILSDRSIMINTHLTDIEWALDYLAKNNFELPIEIHDRVSSPIPYSEIPKFLIQYGIYIDIRYINGVLLANLSKTALEALACGLKVLTYDLRYIEELPEVNRPESVVNRLLNLYR